jgi:LuxR family maltose regulon positive regulatory protein
LRLSTARTWGRPGVDRLLDGGAVGRLTAVSAGAGWGKTTAVQAWSRSREDPVAWVSLDSRDVAPQALVSRVLDALRGCGAVPAGHELARLRVPPTSTEAFMARWLRGLASLPAPTTVVVDDFDLIRHHNVVATIRDVLSVEGPIRWMLLGRADPPVARREATVITADDLAFTLTDVIGLAELEGVTITTPQAQVVLDQTQGWPAGVRIALSRLARLQRTVPEPDDADVEGALVDDRAVADYLLEEVVDRQEPPVRTFLLRSSVVPTFSPELARALTPHAEPGRLEAALAATHDFVGPVAPAGAESRYHPILREILHTTLRVRDPEGHQDAHLCAARWLMRHGDPVAALDHAVEAGDSDLAGRVLAHSAAPLLLGPGREAVRQTLLRLPFDGSPTAVGDELCAAALALVDRAFLACRAHADRARATLEDSGTRPETASLVLARILEAAAARGQGDVEAQERAAGAAITELSRASWPFPAYSAYLRSARELHGTALLWQADPHAARDELTSCIAEAPHAADLTSLSARSSLSLAHAFLGHLDSAERLARRAIDLATTSGWTSYTYVRAAYAGLAWVSLMRGRWVEADRAVAYGQAASEVGAEPPSLAALQLVQALAAVSRGRRRAAALALSAVPPGPDPAMIAAMRQRAEYEVAATTGAGTVYSGEDRIASPADALAAARRALTRGDAGRAYKHARVAVAWSSDVGDPVGEVEAFLVLAEVADRRDQPGRADDLARRALDAAAHDSIVRPFVTPAAPGRGALDRVLTGRRDELADTVRDHIGASDQDAEPDPLVQVLTERELSVLTLLPTMASNQEIADELFVSVNTVKAHLKTLYRKLEVDSRRKAVLRARSLGLLP